MATETWLCEINSNEKSLQKFLLTLEGKVSNRNETKRKRNELETKTKRNEVGSPCGGRNSGGCLGRRVVTEILAEIQVAVWWPKFWPIFFALRTKVTVVD